MSKPGARVPSMVTLVIDVSDEHGHPLGDPDSEVMATLRPTWSASALTAGHIVLLPPVSVRMFGTEFAAVALAATDDERFRPAGWQWEISFTGLDLAPGVKPLDLRAEAGPVQHLSSALAGTVTPKQEQAS